MSQQTWAHQHHRYALTNQVMTDPGMLDRPLPADVVAEFGDRSGVIRALHQRWVTLLEGCLESEMEDGRGDGVDDLRNAYRRAADHSAELFATLRRFADDPLVSRLRDHEYLRLATAVGLLRPGHHVGDAVAEVTGLVAAVAADAAWPQPRRRLLGLLSPAARG